MMGVRPSSGFFPSFTISYQRGHGATVITGAAGAHAGVRGETGGTSEHILRQLAAMGDSHPGTPLSGQNT